MLSPWKHSVAMNSDEKGRPHVVSISTYDDLTKCKQGLTVIKLSMSCKEECLAWMKCVQVGSKRKLLNFATQLKIKIKPLL